jgi:hypothetical protein
MDPTLSRQSAHWWRLGSEPHTLAALYSQKHFFASDTHFCYRLSKPQGLVWPEGLGQLKKSLISSSLKPATFRFVEGASTTMLRIASKFSGNMQTFTNGCILRTFTFSIRTYSSRNGDSIRRYAEFGVAYLIFTVPWDCLCGLVVRVPGYRSGGTGSIPYATRFSEK